MPETTRLVPVNGTWVCEVNGEDRGTVKEQRTTPGREEVFVKWFSNRQNEWKHPDSLRNGFRLGMSVQDCPRSRVRHSLGEGFVVENRSLGGREQVLVEFPQAGTRFWLPYENLRAIKSPEHRFIVGKLGEKGNAERFRLRCLAHALEMWNENTGALSHLEIDPLPHQIHLVHHILASGNLNWLIADDVGLGKTIEVGMLLAALRQRGIFRRVLIVTPAGLVEQWKQELYYKFSMDDFRIYGRDFEVHETREWKLYDHVIGSIDRFKSERHLESLLQADNWDLIIFDEAHRLSRRQWGMRYSAAERFKLAAALRDKSDSMLLLTATPHQGMQDKFQALLELLRPEWKDEIAMLSFNPEILGQMVIRNRKADVTDAKGDFIFRGKVTRAVEVPVSEEAESFDKALRRYLRNGYAAGEAGGQTGRAIGFVMTIYRKLAASSVAAILTALKRRIQRLRDQVARDGDQPNGLDEADERFQGEWEEGFDTAAVEFFQGEIALLEELIRKASNLLSVDQKLDEFLDALVGTILGQNKLEKVLVFTEYRATQEYIAMALSSRFGPGKVNLIHGSQKHEERAQQIAHFEDAGQFLISTEAGGEGINLHRRCHIMVNYDLPWNPMRLVQRVGRLYRYGQKETVIVFNIHAPQSIDEQIMGLMYNRIDQVVADMATVGEEFNAGLADDILGEVTDMLDVEKILEEAASAGIERTSERIEDALEKARQAADKQRELFEHATGFNPDELRFEMNITAGHARAYLEGAFTQHGIEIVEITHGGRVLDLKLSEKVQAELHWSRRRIRATLDRGLAADRPDLHMLDFNSPLFQHLLKQTKCYEFGGLAAGLQGLPGRSIITAMLRWQNDQGHRMRQEYTALLFDEDMNIDVNPQQFSDWLLEPALDAEPQTARDEAKVLQDKANEAFNSRLGAVSNADLHPENRQWIATGRMDADVGVGAGTAGCHGPP